MTTESINGVQIDLEKVLTGVRRIFWGGLIIAFDWGIHVERDGVIERLNLFPDFLGWLLILAGVRSLARVEGGKRFELLIRLVTYTVIVSFVESVVPWERLPGNWAVLHQIMGIVTITGYLLFSNAMVSLFRAHNSNKLLRTWARIRIFFLIFYVGPFLVIIFYELASLFFAVPVINFESTGSNSINYLIVVLIFIWRFIPLYFVWRARKQLDKSVSELYADPEYG